MSVPILLIWSYVSVYMLLLLTTSIATEICEHIYKKWNLEKMDHHHHHHHLDIFHGVDLVACPIISAAIATLSCWFPVHKQWENGAEWVILERLTDQEWQQYTCMQQLEFPTLIQTFILLTCRCEIWHIHGKFQPLKACTCNMVFIIICIYKYGHGG